MDIKISVIVPTHNRPELLREAIASIAEQTYHNWEAVIIDDASIPVVDGKALQEEFGGRISVLRNKTPIKSAQARRQGVKHAEGELVIHLDDDDKFSPNAFELAVDFLDRYPECDLLFLGVSGFGERSEYFNIAQQQAMEKVIERGKGVEIEQGVWSFKGELFNALLYSVPMSFQRTCTRRSAWEKVEKLRSRAYGIESGLPDGEAIIKFLKPPLRDCEWSLYASAILNSALLSAPVYQQRCDGQGEFSVPSNKERASKAMMGILERLSKSAIYCEELKIRDYELRMAIGRAHFERAYSLFKQGNRFSAYGSLLKAIRVSPSMFYFRFALRMLLPRT